MFHGTKFVRGGVCVLALYILLYDVAMRTVICFDTILHINR